MNKAMVVQRVGVVCPVCKHGDFVVNRRMPGIPSGHVEKRCTCQRCATTFVYVEDRLGRPVRR